MSTVDNVKIEKIVFQGVLMVAYSILFQLNILQASPIYILTNRIINQDTIKERNKLSKTEWTQKIITQEGDKKVVLETRNGEIINFEINGKIIPKDEYDQYDDIIKKHTKMNDSEKSPAGRSNFSFDDFDSKNFEMLGDSTGVFKFRIQDIDSIFGESTLKMNEGGTLELKLNQLFNNPLGDTIFSKMFDRNKGFGGGVSLPEGFEGLFNFSRPLKMEIDEFGFTPKQLPEINSGGYWEGNAKSKNLEELLGEQLNKDGLLTAEKENKIELSGKYLRINGLKQPQVTFEKYKNLFEIETGMPLNEATILSFKMTGKSAARKFKAF